MRAVTTNTLDASRERDTGGSVPPSARVARRSEPIGNAYRAAAEERHDGQGLPITPSHTPVILIGPLAAILGWMSMVCHCPRDPKPCQERTDPFVESAASAARQVRLVFICALFSYTTLLISPLQLDTLPTIMRRGNGSSNEPTPSVPVATHAGLSIPRVDFTPTLFSMHASLWIYIGLISLCTIGNTGSTSGRGACFCWTKPDDQRYQSLYESDTSATEQALPGSSHGTNKLLRKPMLLAGVVSRLEQNRDLEGGSGPPAPMPLFVYAPRPIHSTRETSHDSLTLRLS
ncbi:hypothetical protein LX36DRAFT_107460 [Colletotrichum falcatum]|nr:hypothetical protein LX36DRAFT_107460 [Colletotrichum falcatum]